MEGVVVMVCEREKRWRLRVVIGNGWPGTTAAIKGRSGGDGSVGRLIGAREMMMVMSQVGKVVMPSLGSRMETTLRVPVFETAHGCVRRCPNEMLSSD